MDGTGFSQLLSEHPFSVVAAVAVFAALGAVIRWLLSSLLRELKEVEQQVVKANDELAAGFDEREERHRQMLVSLIDRVRGLEENRLRSVEDSILRVEMLLRILYELHPELSRVGRSNARNDSGPKGQ